MRMGGATEDGTTLLRCLEALRDFLHDAAETGAVVLVEEEAEAEPQEEGEAYGV